MAALGTGGSIAFDTGFFAEILTVNHSGLTREVVETTHLGTTTARSFVPGTLFDPGEFEVEIAFAAETRPPIDDVAETCTVTITSGGGGGDSTWAASGFMREFSWTMGLEERQTATGIVKLTGDITVTP